MKDDKTMNRRDLFKNAGVAATASLVVAPSVLKASDCGVSDPNKPAKALQAQESKGLSQMPKRKLGRIDLEVPILSLGGMFDTINSQMMLQRAIDFGVTYWDTAHGYVGGKSEKGIGIFLKRNPELREKMFIVTKASGAKDSASRDERLATSLKRLNTSYIDLYYGIHAMKNPKQLTDELRDWGAAAKEKGLIKYFGVSTHTDMAACLDAAAELDWIDAVMVKYNYQMIDDQEMQAAIDKCNKKGIALIAMKTQAKGPVDEPDYKLISHFEEKGFTPEQAKLKAIWQDERFSAICSQMPNFTILNANIAAALDTTKLSGQDVQALKQQAPNNYCAGCEKICSEACSEMPYVADVMRSLMYANSYGSIELGKQAFNEIPQDARNRIANADFSAAQAKCPKNLPIANLMKQAYYQFA